VADPTADKRVYEVYWLNVYGSAMVERIGHERVHTVPCKRLEDLAHGAVLFLTSDTPVDFAEPAARQAQARALAHLRGDTREEAATATLEHRSRMFDTVEPNFDPDIADLLTLTLEDVDFGHRQPKIAELNRYRPPAVSEVRPVSVQPGSDLADPEAEIDRYRDLFAEQLVALLHNKVKGMKTDPAELPAIDYYFWSEDYPRLFKREDIDNDLVPAIGAYLGEILVRHLGGRWVARKNLEESAVIVGNQAWLPFLRARRYMANGQAALDYSLTQFYRVAARSQTVH
jgi:hypothetical protein